MPGRVLNSATMDLGVAEDDVEAIEKVSRRTAIFGKIVMGVASIVSATAGYFAGQMILSPPILGNGYPFAFTAIPAMTLTWRGRLLRRTAIISIIAFLVMVATTVLVLGAPDNPPIVSRYGVFARR